MKKLLLVASAQLALLATAAAVQAQIITSVQFVGGGGAPLKGAFWNYTAGADSVDNWNPELDTANTQVPQSLTVTSGLITSTGSSSSIGFTLNSSGAYYTGATGMTSPNFPTQTSGAGDAWLYDGFAYAGYSDTNPLSLVITGLQPGHAYDLLAYYTPFTFFGNNQSGTISLSGQAPIYAVSDGSASSYELISSTNPASPSTGNYVAFDNLTGVSTETLTLTNTSTLVGISGFQVVDLGAQSTAPEPSTYALLGAGLLGLIVVMRRKARA
jgi:hypothetical protein